LKEQIINFLKNNTDDIILIIFGIVIGAILSAFWKSLTLTIRWSFKFIWKKTTGEIKSFYNWLIRIKNRQLTPEEEFLIMLYRSQEGIVDEVVIDEEWEDNPEVQKYLNKSKMRAGTKSNSDKDVSKPDKIKKPSKWQMKVYEELIKKRNEQKLQRMKARKEQKARFKEMYPDGIPIPNMAKGILPASFHIQFAKEEQKQRDRKTQEDIQKELKKLNKK